MTIISGASHKVTRITVNPPDVSERGLTAEGVDVDGEVVRMVKTHSKSVSTCAMTPQKIRPNPSFCVVSVLCQRWTGPEGRCCIVPGSRLLLREFVERCRPGFGSILRV